ncbi:hypothetical protein TNCV_636981 [Trichonephila clavipes]|nr:hypothetical protein TNCV_636981 [Trichonephila clavipes]
MHTKLLKVISHGVQAGASFLMKAANSVFEGRCPVDQGNSSELQHLRHRRGERVKSLTISPSTLPFRLTAELWILVAVVSNATCLT